MNAKLDHNAHAVLPDPTAFTGRRGHETAGTDVSYLVSRISREGASLGIGLSGLSDAISLTRNH